eukprot:358357_1
MVNPWYVAGAWIQRTLFPFTIVIIALMVVRELHKRKTDTTLENETYKRTQQWLNRWSLSNMICWALTFFCGTIHKIPYLCYYNYAFPYVFWSLCPCLLTMYQITRLKYCFSVKQVHSKKYGYSDFTFTVLHIICLLYAMFVLVIYWISYTVTDGETLGCILGVLPQYLFYPLFAWIWITILDWTVLGMYIYKIYQIRKYTDFKQKEIYERINYILHKIALLTILYEIQTCIQFMSAFLIAQYQWSSVVSPFISSISGILSVMIVYLMIEHNNEEY